MFVLKLIRGPRQNVSSQLSGILLLSGEGGTEKSAKFCKWEPFLRDVYFQG